VEVLIKASIQRIKESIESLTMKLENLSADEHNLATKIEKKKLDLERNQNRLKGMLSVRYYKSYINRSFIINFPRPAFMDEYERLEVELQKQHAIYLERFRNMEYLENEWEQYERAEQEKYEV
jgi:clusterin-associated protein 1